MCTVVFIPIGDQYYFASLRDESPIRPKAKTPELTREGDTDILSPKDARAGGTWIGVSSYGNLIVLLNGGFEKHEQAGTYLKSRGLIVSELLTTLSPVSRWSVMDMQGIEPCTLVVWSEGDFVQLVWDGERKHRLVLSRHQANIWSSATLYDGKARKMRKDFFSNWTQESSPVSPSSLFVFFNSIADRENGFLIDREGIVKTLSFTFVELRTDSSAKMKYHDLVDGTIVEREVLFNKCLPNLPHQ